MSECYLWYGIKLPDQDYDLPWEREDCGDDWGDIDAWWEKVKEPGDENDPPISEIDYAVGGVQGLAVAGAFAWVSDEPAEPWSLYYIQQAIRESKASFLAFIDQHIGPTLPEGWKVRVGWWMGCANT